MKPLRCSDPCVAKPCCLVCGKFRIILHYPICANSGISQGVLTRAVRGSLLHSSVWIVQCLGPDERGGGKPLFFPPFATQSGGGMWKLQMPSPKNIVYIEQNNPDYVITSFWRSVYLAAGLRREMRLACHGRIINSLTLLLCLFLGKRPQAIMSTEVAHENNKTRCLVVTV